VTTDGQAGPTRPTLARTRRRLGPGDPWRSSGPRPSSSRGNRRSSGLSILDGEVDRALEAAATAYLGQLGGEAPSEEHEAGESHAPQASDTFFLILDDAGGLLVNPSGVPLSGLPDRASLQAARAAGRDLRTVVAGGTTIRILTLEIVGEHEAKVGWLQAGS